MLVRGADGGVECGTPIFAADGSLISLLRCAELEVFAKRAFRSRRAESHRDSDRPTCAPTRLYAASIAAPPRPA
jgi:hypothetical protein